MRPGSVSSSVVAVAELWSIACSGFLRPAVEAWGGRGGSCSCSSSSAISTSCLASPQWELFSGDYRAGPKACRAGAPLLLVSGHQHLLLRVQPSGASPATLVQAIDGDPRRSRVRGGRRSRLLLQDFLRVLSAIFRPLSVILFFGSICNFGGDAW
jgi:hypothetical protein